MVGLEVLVENDSIDMRNSEDFNNSLYTWKIVYMHDYT